MFSNEFGPIDFSTLIRSERLTPRYCIELLFNDSIPINEDDLWKGESYILKYQTHITRKQLDIAYTEFLAKNLTRPEKIVLLEMKYKTILEKMSYEPRHHTLRQMIRRMRYLDWVDLLQGELCSP